MNEQQPTTEYDAFADIYDVWVKTAPVCPHNLRFYAEHYRRAEGLVVELGAGNGRILIEAAKRGAMRMLGIDSSPNMLALARSRIDAAGFADRISLQQADFRDFVLPEPAALIAIPFHTIGHLLTLEDKRAAFAHIHVNLMPGGRLIFDHFIYDFEYGRARQGKPELRAEYVDAATGRDCVLWVCSRTDFDTQIMRIVC